jgi:VWFA-related protein
MRGHIAAFALMTAAACATGQQQTAPARPGSAPTQLRARSSLVQVPTLVQSKTGTLVFSLASKDFTIRDNGVEQEVALDGATGEQPIAMAVVFQTGGAGAQQVPNLRHLQTMVEAMIGDVPHRVALVAFDSRVHLLQDFTSNLADIGKTIQASPTGDSGAAILDALTFSINMLRKQPPEMRRAVLLVSGTVDHGSQTTLHQAVRTVSETNTVIYSVAFSTSKAEMRAALANTPPSPASARKRSTTGPTDLSSADTSSTAEPAAYSEAFSALSAAVNSAARNQPSSQYSKGCSQHASQSVGERLGDRESCASFVPLVVFAARMGMNGLARNAPETVARMTGGEYRTFHDEKSLEDGLYTFVNHLPNRYVLSFQPHLPTPGLHTIQVTLKNYPKLQVAARTSYWASGAPSARQNSQ